MSEYENSVRIIELILQYLTNKINQWKNLD